LRRIESKAHRGEAGHIHQFLTPTSGALRMKIKTFVFGYLFVFAFSAPTFAQSLTAPFAGSYSVTDLVSPSGIPIGIGGMAFNPSDPNTLYVVGGADTSSAEVYTINVARNASGQITGFVGTATPYASAPYADTGLVFAPNGTLLYNMYPFSSMGEILPRGFITGNRGHSAWRGRRWWFGIHPQWLRTRGAAT
jgi:hypothetical protein